MELAHHTRPRLSNRCMTVVASLDACQQALACTDDSRSQAVCRPVTSVQCRCIYWHAVAIHRSSRHLIRDG